MDIKVVSTNFYMSGSYINHLDTQQFLVDEGFNSTYYYLDNQWARIWNTLLKTKRKYTLGTMRNLKKVSKIKGDIIITDFRSLILLNHFKKKVECSKLIVMDAVELTYHLLNMEDAHRWMWWDFSYKTPIYNFLDNVKADELTFSMPPCNYKVFRKKYPDLKAKIFFKKINTRVLETIKTKDNGKYFHRWDEPNVVYYILRNIPEIKSFENGKEETLFEYKGFVYCRRKKLRFHEQFGRLIFEFVILGKDVYFLGDPYGIKDGISDYLKHYKIKFNERNKIITKPNDLKEKMTPYGESIWK
jgi:hypothetical protein